MKKRYSNIRCRRKGFAQIVSVLIVSAIGMLFAITLLSIGAGVSKSALVRASYFGARAAADACAEYALLMLKGDPAYSGTSTESIGEGNCTFMVTSVALPDESHAATISAIGTVGRATRRVSIEASVTEVDPAPPEIAILRWSERGEL